MVEMNKADLINRAMSIYRVVLPCGNKSSPDECFAKWDDCLIFWFNTPDHTTHALLTKEDERQACSAEWSSEETATRNGSCKSRLNHELISTP
jgi:hypothetical protein